MLNKKIFTQKLVTYFYALTGILVIAILIFMYSQSISHIESDLKNVADSGIKSFNEILQEERSDSNALKQRILGELDMQLKWEWEYEKFNRSQAQAASYLSFFLDIVILTLTIALISNKEVGNGKLAISRARLNLLIFLAVLNIVVATYISKENFEFKQRAHDLRARDLQTIRVALEIGLMNNQTAWENFRNIYKIGAQEDLIRQFDKNRYSK